MATPVKIIGDISRNAFFDRNAQAISKYFQQNNLANHGGTERWSYTVPAGKIFICGVVGAGIAKIFSAGKKGQCWITLDGNSIFEVSKDETDPFYMSNTITATFVAFEGAVLKGNTWHDDNVTTHNMFIFAIGTEFDA